MNNLTQFLPGWKFIYDRSILGEFHQGLSAGLQRPIFLRGPEFTNLMLQYADFLSHAFSPKESHINLYLASVYLDPKTCFLF